MKISNHYFQNFFVFPILLLLIAIPGRSHGQTNEAYVDSLNSILVSAKEDTLIARTYVRLAEALHVVNLDTVSVLCELALQIVDENLKNELSEKEKVSFLTTKADCMNNLGYYYKYHGDIPKALTYYQKTLAIDERIGNKIGLGFDLNNIGMIYQSQGDLDQTVTYLEMSLKLFREADFPRGVATTLDNLGGVYNKIDPNNDRSIPYVLEALSIREKTNDYEGIVISLNTLGRDKRALDTPESALEYFNRALKLSSEADYNLGRMSSLSNITDYYFKREDWNKAEEKGLMVLELSQEEGAPEYIRDAAFLLKQVYQVKNRPKEELEMYSLYVQMKDSLDNENNRKALYRTQIEYEYEKKKALSTKEAEQKIEFSEEQRNYQVFISITIGVFLLLFVFIAILFFKRWKLSQKQKSIIENQVKELAKSNRENLFMMKEIHHRVKNNFQAVNSLLRFQSREIDDPKIIGMFEACQNRILSMAFVHEEMYRSERFSEIRTQQHLSRLINEIVPQEDLGRVISLEIDIEDILLGTKTLIPLGLIINELVMNSIKHAFQGMDSGIITVSLKSIGGMQYELIFRDNGLGYNESVYEKSTGSSIGLELISVFSEQLDGELIKVNQDTGTCYRLVFNSQDSK